jgi:hypothetical protein
MNKDTYATKLLIEISKSANFVFTKKDIISWLKLSGHNIAKDMINHVAASGKVPYPTPSCLTKYRNSEEAHKAGYSGSLLGYGLLWQQYGMFTELVCYSTYNILLEYLEKRGKKKDKLTILNITASVEKQGDTTCLKLFKNC